MEKTNSKKLRLKDLSVDNVNLFKDYLRKLYEITISQKQNTLTTRIAKPDSTKFRSAQELYLDKNDSRICWLFMYPNSQLWSKLQSFKDENQNDESIDYRREDLFICYGIENPELINGFIYNSTIRKDLRSVIPISGAFFDTQKSFNRLYPYLKLLTDKPQNFVYLAVDPSSSINSIREQIEIVLNNKNITGKTKSRKKAGLGYSSLTIHILFRAIICHYFQNNKDRREVIKYVLKAEKEWAPIELKKSSDLFDKIAEKAPFIFFK